MAGEIFPTSYTFQSTPSARRETYSAGARRDPDEYFNPLPPQGGRQPRATTQARQWQFQSTPSARRETKVGRYREFYVQISIHSLREEGDQTALCPYLLSFQISIHSLREEGDRVSTTILPSTERFQSTPSARRETPLFF